jgi:hypothetical protein
VLCNGPAGAQATAEVSVGTAVPTLERYKAPASADKPRGLSGIACLAEKPAAGISGIPARECVVIIDEETLSGGLFLRSHDDRRALTSHKMQPWPWKAIGFQSPGLSAKAFRLGVSALPSHRSP